MKWTYALTRIPRVGPEEWARMGPFSRWLVVSRAAVLVMTLYSGLLAGVVALGEGRGSPLLWFLATLGSILAHATNNMINDLVDHIRGVDVGNYFRNLYGPQPIASGLVNRRQLMVYIAITGGVAALIGVSLVGIRGLGILPFFLAGAFFVLFYTWPLKPLGLGEPAVFLVWGPLLVLGIYYATTDQLSVRALAVSIPYGLGAASVLMGKHLDKLEHDNERGIRTLPVLLGERPARLLTLGMMVSGYACLALMWILGLVGPLVPLACLGALPVLFRVSRAFLGPKPQNKPEDYPEDIWPLYWVAGAFWHNRRFGGLYILGLLAEALLTRMGFGLWG